MLKLAALFLSFVELIPFSTAKTQKLSLSHFLYISLIGSF